MTIDYTFLSLLSMVEEPTIGASLNVYILINV